MVITRLMAVFNIWRSKVGQEMIFCQIWLVHVTVITPSTIGRHKLLLTHCHSLLCTEASLRIINTVHDSQRRSHECCLKAVCWSAWACVLRASLSVSGGCLVTLSPRPRHLIHHPMPGDVRGDRWSLVCQGATRARFMRGNKTEMRHCKTVCVELAP